MNPTIEISFKTAQAYSAMCKPLCQELKLPQTAFDILMFLANNPDCTTARDIVEIRKIKANLVSVNVDRLVQEGYLERRAVAGGRPQTPLAWRRAPWRATAARPSCCAPKRRSRSSHGGARCRSAFLPVCCKTPMPPPGRRFSAPWRSSGKIWTRS